MMRQHWFGVSLLTQFALMQSRKAQDRRRVVMGRWALALCCGSLCLVLGASSKGEAWADTAVSAATPPEPKGDMLEDIAWVQATTGHPAVPGDKTYSLRDTTEGMGWAFPPHVLEGFLEQGIEDLYVAPLVHYQATAAYQAATEANAGRARLRLDSEPYGELVEEIDGKLVPYSRPGLPFPVITPDDPQAGRKLIHNFLAADKGGGQASLDISVYILNGEGGQLARTELLPPGLAPIWTESARGTVARRFQLDCLYAQLARGQGFPDLWESRFDFNEPPETQDNKMIAVRSLDPRARERGFMYLRETRKATAAAMPKKHELFMGTHYPLDAFWGWEGHEYYWRFQFVGEAWTPTIAHSTYPNPRFTGRWGSIPDNMDHWELRRSFVVLAQSREAENPWPYRLLFFDQEMQRVNMTLLYDQEGRFYAVDQLSYVPDAATGLPIVTGMSLRLRHKPEATLVVFPRDGTFVTENTPTKLRLFSTASLLAGETIRGYLKGAGYVAHHVATATVVPTK